MRTFIVSMSLATNNGQTEKAEQSSRKPKKTSAEEWAAVHAIAQEYAQEIDNAVALREKLKTSECYLPNGSNIRNPGRGASSAGENRKAVRTGGEKAEVTQAQQF